MKEHNEIAVQYAAITEVKIKNLFDDPTAVNALFVGFTRLLALQEEYYRHRPFRRLLRNLRLLPDPYVPARLWALEQIEGCTDERT